MYELRVITWSGSGVMFRQAETWSGYITHGSVPSTGDLLTIHPNGEPDDDSFTCKVTGVQRVARGLGRGHAAETAVCVTAKIEGTV